MPSTHCDDPARVAVIIPALDEAETLSSLLPALSTLRLGQIIVADNGSTDGTHEAVVRQGATWAYEPKRGYGSACYAGMQRLADSIEIVVFVDADQGRDIHFLPALVAPIARGECDFVIGARVSELRESRSTTWPQRFGNWLMPRLIRWGWGHTFTDLGPCRAIRRSALEAIGMRDRAYGWTIEMQIRAVELGLRIREIAMPHRKRQHGRDKISGTFRGVALAGYWIVRTCAFLWLTKSRRIRSDVTKRKKVATIHDPSECRNSRAI